MKGFRDHQPEGYSGRKLGADPEKTWVKQEKRLAKRSGGRVQPGSGSGPIHKGDVKTDTFLIEAKSTDNKSISIKLDYLTKIGSEALADGKTPALAITFGEVPLGTFRDWILVPKHVLFDGD